MWESAVQVEEEPKAVPHFGFLGLAQGLSQTLEKSTHVSNL
jgi:hypothetical protein